MENLTVPSLIPIASSSFLEKDAWDILAGISTLESALPNEHFSPKILVFSINFWANCKDLKSAVELSHELALVYYQMHCK